MGTAILVKGVDFSKKNLGKVTMAVPTPITGLQIICPSSIEGNTMLPSVIYVPAGTTERGVVWSIISGNSFASIDASSGLITINSTANQSTVRIKAISNINPAISAEKDVIMTYKNPKALTSISIVASESYTTPTFQPTIQYVPSDTTEKGVQWSITSGNSFASIDAGSGLVTVLDGANQSSITIKATSLVHPDISDSKTVTVSRAEEGKVTFQEGLRIDTKSNGATVEAPEFEISSYLKVDKSLKVDFCHSLGQGILLNDDCVFVECDKDEKVLDYWPLSGGNVRHITLTGKYSTKFLRFSSEMSRGESGKRVSDYVCIKDVTNGKDIYRGSKYTE